EGGRIAQMAMEGPCGTGFWCNRGRRNEVPAVPRDRGRATPICGKFAPVDAPFIAAVPRLGRKNTGRDLVSAIIPARTMPNYARLLVLPILLTGAAVAMGQPYKYGCHYFRQHPHAAATLSAADRAEIDD